jgi:ArsR family transcriptional regulator, arsenate/arsenite/antimonite-responsive transcriptional repressor
VVELIKILKAFSDETRYILVKLLLRHDLCVGALATRLNISESAVSQHLKVLRGAGIVKGDKRGYYTHYYVDREILKQAAGQITELSRVIPLDKEWRRDRLNKEYPCSRKKVDKTDL